MSGRKLTRSIRFSVPLFALTACAACAGDARMPDQVRTDSAGVAIIESTSPVWAGGEGFSVAREPVLDLALVRSGTDHEFYGVSDGARLSDGTLVLAEGSTSQIKYYSPAGAYLGSFGGEGEGPGEFRRIRSVEALPGDTLVVYDARNVRVTWITPDRQLAGEASLTMRAVTRVAALEPGVMLVGLGSFEATPTGDGHQRWPRHYVRVDQEGALIDTVLYGRGSESVGLELGDAVPLLGRDTYVAVRDGRVYLGDSDSLEVRTYDADGRLERQVRVAGFDLSGAEEAAAEEAALRVEINRGNREINEMLPIPSSRPAYSAIHVDPLGYVWTAEHKGRFRNLLEDSPVEWQVFDPDGEWLGAVQLPGRFQVFEIGEDFVWGLRRDAIDIERPQLVRLNR